MLPCCFLNFAVFQHRILSECRCGGQAKAGPAVWGCPGPRPAQFCWNQSLTGSLGQCLTTLLLIKQSNEVFSCYSPCSRDVETCVQTFIVKVEWKTLNTFIPSLSLNLLCPLLCGPTPFSTFLMWLLYLRKPFLSFLMSLTSSSWISVIHPCILSNISAW